MQNAIFKRFFIVEIAKEISDYFISNQKVCINWYLFKFKITLYICHSCNMYLKICFIFRTCSYAIICLLTQICVSHLEYRCTVRNIVLSQCSPEKLSQNTQITQISQISSVLPVIFCFFLIFNLFFRISSYSNSRCSQKFQRIFIP